MTRRTGGAGTGGGTPGVALPGDLERALHYLDDAQLDRLVKAAAAEAQQRGRQAGEETAAESGRKGGKGPGRAARGRSDRQAAPVTPGQERLIRAAFEAGLTPSAIAREFRLSRTQVERVVGAAGRRR